MSKRLSDPVAPPPSKKMKMTGEKSCANDEGRDQEKKDEKVWNWCEEIRASSEKALKSQEDDPESKGIKDVWIDEDAIKSELEKNKKDYNSDKFSIENIGWRKEEFHFFDATNERVTCQYILVLDTLNFCFWPLEKFEYDNLARSLKQVLVKDSTAFEAKKLMQVTEETLSDWLHLSSHSKSDTGSKVSPKTEAPSLLLKERVRLLRETGRALCEKFGGECIRMIESAENNALKLLQLIIENFRGFSDIGICPWTGEQTFFYKRAQIFVGDICMAFENKGIGYFHNIHQITCFADYRIPQLLQSLGIIQYSERLQTIIHSKKLIPQNSRFEILIRSATICAVEKIKFFTSQLFHKQYTSMQLDVLLWNRGELLSKNNLLAPHHRTLSIFY
ncbi:hypothetical protein RFI_13480 [Reticulomyxa filosa]|uniref:Queuosine 5'-phosphate N-glycosylase/hydrolase n=1 Tax=Reticulomyxa filosa TaxID=46433 RepID=X6ND47_RETFI|nr:hypothetical protein RFI_13480 [Reticulomyxa filosa]|eukprot:ETO23699.1 hypothetical protein RFI_13480 [Reticulomyxa filosa]